MKVALCLEMLVQDAPLMQYIALGACQHPEAFETTTTSPAGRLRQCTPSMHNLRDDGTNKWRQNLLPKPCQRHAKRAGSLQIATKSASQALPKTRQESGSITNIDEICLPGPRRAKRAGAPQIVTKSASRCPRHAKRARAPQIATNSAFQALPKTCQESGSATNSDKICFPSLAQDTPREWEHRKQ